MEKIDLNALQLVKNEYLSQFELHVGNYVVFTVYEEVGQVITIVHTESPVELEGKGVASVLIDKTLHYIEDNDYKLVPLCPFVFAYIKRHPEWLRVVHADYMNLFK